MRKTESLYKQTEVSNSLEQAVEEMTALFLRDYRLLDSKRHSLVNIHTNECFNSTYRNHLLNCTWKWQDLNKRLHSVTLREAIQTLSPDVVFATKEQTAAVFGELPRCKDTKALFDRAAEIIRKEGSALRASATLSKLSKEFNLSQKSIKNALLKSNRFQLHTRVNGHDKSYWNLVDKKSTVTD